ncbi:MAG: toprim domain-containing protein [Candidatus Heimdallarchaeaceae archaeon]
MAQKYSAKDIRVLEEVEHIRLNPGMYIGQTDNPVHLIEEALDNALDEALAGYADIIAVLIDTKKHCFSVIDNGRGIPIAKNTPVTISSKLFSGAKFQDAKTAYQISSGLHGVGLVAINALSSEYNVEIYRNGQHAIYNFKNAKLKYSRVQKFSGNEIPFSTKIEFIPNKKFFETLVPDIERIRKRLTTASAEMSKISFALIIDETRKEVFRLSMMDNFINELITTKNKLEVLPLMSEKKPEKFLVTFTYEDQGPISPKIFSSINLLPVESGGTHVNCFYDLLKEFFTAKAKKYGYTFQSQDVLVRLRAYFTLSLVEPKFSGQTKDKLTNRKTYFEKFLKDFKSQLEKITVTQEPLIIKYLESFQDYRKKLDSKKLKSTTVGGRRGSTEFTKLRDCISRKGELFIVEGDSAGGSIIQSRDPRIHAVLPLRGKSIPNVTGKKNILQNKEVAELIKAIGTGIGPDFKLSRMRYDKIICASDADPDGAHITCLLVLCISILLPEIVQNSKLFVAQTPLFAVNEKRLFRPLWSDKELEKARSENRIIQRYKGLGEMNPSQLKKCLLDEKTRHLIPVTYSNDINSLVKLFSSAGEKRELLS